MCQCGPGPTFIIDSISINPYRSFYLFVNCILATANYVYLRSSAVSASSAFYYELRITFISFYRSSVPPSSAEATEK